jgi:pyocin large subunit-like protein
LDNKYETHVRSSRAEFGDISKTEYYNRAKDLFKNKIGGDVLGFKTTTGDIFKFNQATGEFLYGTIKTGIITFFKPTDGIKYWFTQVTKYSGL